MSIFFKILSQRTILDPSTLLCLLDDKILGLSKLKAFADDKLNVTQNVKVVFHRIKNIVGKEENAGYQHFLLFPQRLQKAFSSPASKVVTIAGINFKFYENGGQFLKKG